MIPNELHDFLHRNHIIVAVVVCLKSGEMTTIGERDSLESDHVVSMLFDDFTPEGVDEYLRDQILPRMVQQGRVCGVICKPTPTTIVGLYYHDEGDVVRRYHLSKQLDNELRSLWEK